MNTRHVYLDAMRFVLSYKSPAILILAICLVTGIPHHALAATWTRQAEFPLDYFKGLASSADGQIIVTGGISSDKGIYLSEDGGETWEEVLSEEDSGSVQWSSFAMSSDGQDIVGVQDGGYIWVSHNGGGVWDMEGPSAENWMGVTMTADGGYLAAVSGYDTNLMLSDDGGTTWVVAGEGEAGYLSQQYWDTVSYSPDGGYLVVGGWGDIAVSRDQGASWTEGVGPLSSYWYTVAAANDGTIVAGGYLDLYISHNGGVSWSDTAVSDENGEWTYADISDDGSTIIAGTDGGYVWLSSNSGSTWEAQTDINTTDWTGVTLAADGSLAAAVGGYANLYTYDADGVALAAPGAPTLESAEVGDTQVALSWVAPEDDGGDAITNYLIEYKLNSDDEWSTYAHEDSTDTSIIVGELTNDLLYDFRVSAINDIGTGDPSDAISATPTAGEEEEEPVVSHRSHGGGGGQSPMSAQSALIASLRQQIAELTARLGGIPSGSTSTIGVRDLTVGMSGTDVTALQTLLIAQGYAIPAGATGFFVNQTRDALAKYQAAHDITPAIGYFGVKTRAQMKSANLAGLWW